MPTPALTLSQIDAVLSQGELSLVGQLQAGSNYSFLVLVKQAELEIAAIYKPTRGERPLWDFAAGTLGKREAAAYCISNALGWELVPPTVYREGIYGLGSVQCYIEHDPNLHYFALTPTQKEALQPFVLFDYITNNADRKGGHILLDQQGHFWGIDHGLCFHREYKMRTVIWDFSGQPIPSSLLGDLQHLLQQLQGENELLTQLSHLLNIAEIASVRRRIRGLLKKPLYPKPRTEQYYPWPPI